VIGSTLLAIGAEVIFGSFFLSYLMIRVLLNDPDAPLQDAASVRIAEPTRTFHEYQGAHAPRRDHNSFHQSA
jgi:hypothetical protein